MKVKALWNHLAPLSLAAILAIPVNGALAQDHRRDYDRDHDHDRGHSERPPEYHFRDDDRGRFRDHYRGDADRWRGRQNRPNFAVGGYIPRNYAIRPVPGSYWRGGPPPPPGYQYGYYDGYVVAYNPVNRLIADVLDLAVGNP